MFGVGRFVSAYVMGYFSPSRLMGAYALTNVGLLLFAILHPGWLGMAGSEGGVLFDGSFSVSLSLFDSFISAKIDRR